MACHNGNYGWQFSLQIMAGNFPCKLWLAIMALINGNYSLQLFLAIMTGNYSLQL